MDTSEKPLNSQPTAQPLAPAGSVELPHNPLPGEHIVHPPVAPLTINKPKGHKTLFIVLGIVLTFIILLGSAGGVFAAVAYDKLSLNNPELEDRISQMVIALPFMPKTPEFILNESALAHAKHTKHAFNLSLSAQSDEPTTSTLGLNNFDVEAKGSIDYTEAKNVMFSINASVTKDFNIDIRKKDPIVYFKINKVPALVYSFMQLEQAKVEPIITQWIQYDTSTLDTEARRTLDSEVEEGNSITDKYIEDTLNDLLALDNMKMSDEEMDGVQTHLFDLQADDRTIDDLIMRINNRAEGRNENMRTLQTDADMPKPSEYIKDLHIKVWIEKRNYLVRKISTSFEYDPNGLTRNQSAIPTHVLGLSTDILGVEDIFSTPQAKYKVVSVVGMSDFGKEIEVEVPPSALKPEEIMDQIMGLPSGELSNRSNDAQRLTDLANLQQAINVAVQEDTGTSEDILCAKSSIPCIGKSNTGTRLSDGTGWVKSNLDSQKYVSIPVLPEDPVNDENYHYTYCSDGRNWEINTILASEQQAPKMKQDGGDDDMLYEVGSNLTLIGSTGKCVY